MPLRVYREPGSKYYVPPFERDSINPYRYPVCIGDVDVIWPIEKMEEFVERQQGHWEGFHYCPILMLVTMTFSITTTSMESGDLKNIFKDNLSLFRILTRNGMHFSTEFRSLEHDRIFVHVTWASNAKNLTSFLNKKGTR